MTPIRFSSWPRGVWIALALLMLLVFGVAACEIAGWPFLREPAQDQLSRRLARNVRIDPPFRLHLLGHPSLTAGNLWIAAPPEFDSPHFVAAQDIELGLRYADLWAWRHSGELRVRSLTVGSLDARLLRRSDGQATWQFRPHQPDEPQPPLPTVDHLAVRQGSLVLQDPIAAVDLRATFDTREGSATAAPVAHLVAQGEFRKRPIKGELSTTGWLPVMAQGSGDGPVPAKGWLEYGGLRGSFDGEVQDIFGRHGLKGTVTLRGPSLSLLGRLIGSPLPVTAPFSLKGTVDHESAAWKAVIETAEIGRSELSGHFTYQPGADLSHLEGELKGKRFVLADLGPAFGTRDEDGRPVAPPPGHVLPHRRLDLAALKKLEARIDINLARVELGKIFAQPITPLKAALTLKAGRLALADLEARTAQGRLTGQVAVDAGPEVPPWQADLALDGLHLEEWFKGGRARVAKADKEGGTEAATRPYVTGTLHGRAKLAGQGRSSAEILASLHGETTLFLQNGTLSHLVVEALGLDLAQGLGLVLRGDEPLPIRCAVMDLEGKGGTFTPKVALVDTPVTLIVADGTVDLAHEALNLRLVAKPKNVSPFTLRSPLHLEGPFIDPKATPEAAPIAARVLGGLALAAVNPIAAILPFLDPGEEVASPCRQALAKLKH